MWIFHEFLQTLRKRQQFSTSSFLFEGRNLSTSLGRIFLSPMIGSMTGIRRLSRNISANASTTSALSPLPRCWVFGFLLVGSTAFTYGRVGCGMWICPGKEEGYPGLQWYDQREGAYWSVGAAFDASVPFTPRSSNMKSNMKTEKSLKIAKENEQPNFIFVGDSMVFSDLEYK